MILLFVSLLTADQFITGVVKDAGGKPAAGVVVGVSALSKTEVPETTTNAEGRFSLPVPKSLRKQHPQGGLYAHHPKLGATVRSLAEGETAGIELQLADKLSTRFTVLDADGKPLANALVKVRRVRHPPYGVVIYGTPFERWSARTDAAGVVILPFIESRQLNQIEIETSGPPQQFHALKDDHDWKTVRLVPTRKVKGRFTGQPWPKGAEISVFVTRASESKEHFLQMDSRVKPNDDGSFVATVMADGFWSVRLETQDVYQTKRDERLRATADAPEAQFELAATTPVTGSIRTSEGKPVPDASVSFFAPPAASASLKSDADGKFAGRVPPGKVRVNIESSDDFCSNSFGREQIEIPVSATVVELPTMRVAAAGAVLGFVRDERGRPAAGAKVAAMCNMSLGGGRGLSTTRTAVSGPDGAFRVAGIPKDARVTLHAYHAQSGEFATTIDSKVGDKDKVLKLDPATGAKVVVNLTDESGKPIEAAEVQVDRDERMGNYWFQTLRSDLYRPIKLTAPGRLKLGAVPKSQTLRITAKAPGYLTATSDWVTGTGFDAPISIKMRRGLEAEGEVRDSSGRFLEGVVVKPTGCYGSEAKATTDRLGRFKLSGLPSSTAVLTASKDGFRHGGGIAKIGTPVRIVLKRPDEPAPRAMATEFPNRAANEQLAKRLTDPLADAVFSAKGESKTRWAQSYAYMNPSKLLDLLDGKQWSDQDRDFARYHIAAALSSTDVDEAIAQANAIGAADQKASALQKVASNLPDSEKDKRRRLLADALAAVRAGADPARRTLFIAKIGEELHKLGDPVGEKTIREAHELAKKLPKEGWSSFAVGCVAESLALVDFEAAMELSKDLPGHKGEDRFSGGGSDSYAFNRHRGNIAHKIAKVQPANAEKALASMTESGNRPRIAPRVCYRMAPVDIERAKRIAAAIGNPTDKAVALCVMATALGRERRSETAPMVKEAFTALAGSADAFPFGGGPIALSFLDAAAVAAPNDLDEYFWKALAMAGSTRNSFRNPHSAAERSGAIGAACLLSQRFDAEVAAAFAAALATETDAVVEQLGEIRGNSDSPLLALAGLLVAKPESVEAVVKKWPAVVGGGSLSTADRARLTIGSMLMANPARRNDRIAERFLHRWIIDEEDL